jgi:sulfate transport system ATP-binding protein
VTSLLVTLVQSKALEVADTVVLVNAGQIEQMDTPEEACRRPATPFVASFFQHGGASRAPRAGGSHSG